MGHPFEEHSEAEVPASPEEVWAAIATGPGIDSWFMGRTDVQPGADGTVRTAMGEYTMESAVTAWAPARRLAYRSDEAPDGRFIAFDFLIEGREGGSTVLRNVSTGFLPGDDWADEYEAMKLGGALYFRTLAEYLTYFAGRRALPVTASGPAGTTWVSDQAAIFRSLGLPGSAGHGDRVSFTAGSTGREDGVVYFANAATIGIRTPDALYRFIRGFGRPLVADGKLFAPEADPAGAQLAWESWLSQVLSPKG
ncbi:MAG TPA: SRPBCC domain-containing protein [Streptosporangiaceae bacterium]